MNVSVCRIETKEFEVSTRGLVKDFTEPAIRPASKNPTYAPRDAQISELRTRILIFSPFIDRQGKLVLKYKNIRLGESHDPFY